MIKMRSLWALLDILVFIGAEGKDSTKCSCDPEAVWINQGIPIANHTFAPVSLEYSNDGCDLTVRCDGLYPLAIGLYYSKTIEGNCPDLDPHFTATLAEQKWGRINETYSSFHFDYLRCIKGNWMVYVSDTGYLAENTQCDPNQWVMYNNIFCVQLTAKSRAEYYPDLPAGEPLHVKTSATPPALTPKQCTTSLPASSTTVACPPSTSTWSTKKPFPFSSSTNTRKSDPSTSSLSTSTSNVAASTTVSPSTTTIKLEVPSISSSTSTPSTTTSNKFETPSSTTVPSTTSTKRDSACVDGFEVVNASYFGDGDVGGYFSHENSCRELCTNNFGMRNCLGYAYEPDSRGKCTLLERINLIRASDPAKTTRLVVKC